MTILDGVDELQENVLDECIIPKVATIIQYLREEVVVRGIIQDDVGIAVILYDTVERNDAMVCRRKLVERDFADVDLPAHGWLVVVVHQAFDRIRFWVEGVRFHRAIDDAIAPNAQNLYELQRTAIYTRPKLKLRCGRLASHSAVERRFVS